MDRGDGPGGTVDPAPDAGTAEGDTGDGAPPVDPGTSQYPTPHPVSSTDVEGLQKVADGSDFRSAFGASYKGCQDDLSSADPAFESAGADQIDAECIRRVTAVFTQIPVVVHRVRPNGTSPDKGCSGAWNKDDPEHVYLEFFGADCDKKAIEKESSSTRRLDSVNSARKRVDSDLPDITSLDEQQPGAQPPKAADPAAERDAQQAQCPAGAQSCPPADAPACVPGADQCVNREQAVACPNGTDPCSPGATPCPAGTEPCPDPARPACAPGTDPCPPAAGPNPPPGPAPAPPDQREAQPGQQPAQQPSGAEGNGGAGQQVQVPERQDTQQGTQQRETQRETRQEQQDGQQTHRQQQKKQQQQEKKQQNEKKEKKQEKRDDDEKGQREQQQDDDPPAKQDDDTSQSDG